jgi:hypothetical protein
MTIKGPKHLGILSIIIIQAEITQILLHRLTILTIVLT